MQVSPSPGFLPRLTNEVQTQQITPVVLDDERNRQQNVPVQVTPGTVAEQARSVNNQQNRRFSFTQIPTESGRIGQALQVYFDIQTQAEQERSQALLGIDIEV